MIRNVIRVVAIILIVLPEPFTTPLGIALLSASLRFKDTKRENGFGDPDVLLKRSLKTADFSQTGNWFDNRRISAGVLHHTLKTSMPQYEATPIVAAMPSTRAVERHTLNTNWLPQYTKADLNTPDPPAMSGPVVHHQLKKNLFESSNN
jgi:hypothetical protein